MIRGYAGIPSLLPGDVLTLHIATDAPRFRVEFFRQGAALEKVADAGLGPLAGIDVPDGPPDLDWGWPGYDFGIPEPWKSGVYVANLIEIAADGTEQAPDAGTSFATEAKLLFVVRHRGEAPLGTILYKVSWATFVAYNGTGYGSLYAEAVWSRQQPQPGFKVTWRRPGCGTGGLVMLGDSDDAYDSSSRRQTFEHWDAPLVRWLEAEGFPVHYCTDWDLHRDPELLQPYSLVLSVGHDEYWSDAMRDALDAHVAGGGNIAFFSGNISGYRIHFVDDDTALTCAKAGPADKDPDRWNRDSWMLLRPETRLLGVATAFGGGWWDGKRTPQGYRVQHAAHWVYEGSGLAEGEEFGADPDFPLIGYEVDGCVVRSRGGKWFPSGEGGTPADFLILGLAELGEGWVASRSDAVAAMGLHVSPRGGIVFQGATTDWPIVVPRNPAVAAITRNVVDNLRLPALRVLGPLPHRGGRMLAECGATASFHVDTGRNRGSLPTFSWNVGGAAIVRQDGPVVHVRMPDTQDFVTVSVVAQDGSSKIGFGTRTLLPLSAEDSLRLDITVGLREMVMPGEPSNPLVSPASDPLDRSWLLFSIRVPWIEQRAERVRIAAERLIALRRSAGPDDGKGTSS